MIPDDRHDRFARCAGFESGRCVAQNGTHLSQFPQDSILDLAASQGVQEVRVRVRAGAEKGGGLSGFPWSSVCAA
jgi:hypothetical protein